MEQQPLNQHPFPQPPIQEATHKTVVMANSRLPWERSRLGKGGGHVGCASTPVRHASCRVQPIMCSRGNPAPLFDCCNTRLSLFCRTRAPTWPTATSALSGRTKTSCEMASGTSCTSRRSLMWVYVCSWCTCQPWCSPRAGGTVALTHLFLYIKRPFLTSHALLPHHIRCASFPHRVWSLEVWWSEFLVLVFSADKTTDLGDLSRSPPSWKHTASVDPFIT